MRDDNVLRLFLRPERVDYFIERHTGILEEVKSDDDLPEYVCSLACMVAGLSTADQSYFTQMLDSWLKTKKNMGFDNA